MRPVMDAVTMEADLRPCDLCQGPVQVLKFIPEKATIVCETCQVIREAQMINTRNENEIAEAWKFFESFGKVVGVPKRYESSSLSSWRGPIPKDESGSRDWAREWIKDPSRNIVLSGNAGSGKTHLAVALLRGLWVDRGIFFGMRFYAVPLLNADLMGEMKADMGPITRLPRVLSGTGIVLFDDVARLRETKFASEELATIIYQRHAEERVGIFTTNRTPRQLYEGDPTDGYPGDAATWSRVLEGAIVVTDFPKKDMRLA